MADSESKDAPQDRSCEFDERNSVGRPASVDRESVDQETFALEFSIHRGRLKRMLAHRIDHRLLVRTDLSDILQDVYIEALKRIEHYLKNPEVSLYVWLRQIALQRMIDVHRQHLTAEKRSLRSESPMTQSPYRGAGYGSTASHSWAAQLVANQISPSQIAMHDEMVDRVEKTIEKMDPLDREILDLRHFEEMKNNEVAEVLGLTPAAASNRYIRALKRLKEALVDGDFFGTK